MDFVFSHPTTIYHFNLFFSLFSILNYLNRFLLAPAASLSFNLRVSNSLLFRYISVIMQLFNAIVSTLLLVAATNAQSMNDVTVHVVQVGGNNSLTFSPDNIQAQPGEVVQFQFMSGVGHAVFILLPYRRKSGFLG